MSEIKSYKVAVLGDAKVGKSAFIRKHCTGEFIWEYRATSGVDVRSLSFHLSDSSDIKFTIWDIAGQSSSEQIKENLNDCDAVIIVCDMSQKTTYESAIKVYYSMARSLFPDIPIVILGNKVDLLFTHTRQNLTSKEIKRVLPQDVHFYDYSAKSNYNFEKPFLYIMRKIKNDENLSFRETPMTASQ